MKFSADSQGPCRMNPTDFADPLIFPLVPPWADVRDFDMA